MILLTIENTCCEAFQTSFQLSLLSFKCGFHQCPQRLSFKSSTTSNFEFRFQMRRCSVCISLSGSRKNRGYGEKGSGDSEEMLRGSSGFSGFERADFGGDYGLTGVFGVSQEMDELDQRLIAAIEADSTDPLLDLGPLDVDSEDWTKESDGEADAAGAPRKVLSAELQTAIGGLAVLPAASCCSSRCLFCAGMWS